MNSVAYIMYRFFVIKNDDNVNQNDDTVNRMIDGRREPYPLNLV